MNKYIKYFKYVFKHKWYVLKYCTKQGIIWRGLTHDMSKFLPDEFIPYTHYFHTTSKTYEHYEKTRSNFRTAWLKHLKRNKHHPQYWVPYPYINNGTSNAIEMPEQYRKEMMADWKGAGMALKGFDDTVRWYELNKRSIRLHPRTRSLVEQDIEATK